LAEENGFGDYYYDIEEPYGALLAIFKVLDLSSLKIFLLILMCRMSSAYSKGANMTFFIISNSIIFSEKGLNMKMR
jgi:hypothetical protein